MNYSIVLVSNEDYVKYASVLITSIILQTNAQTKDFCYDFYLLSDALSEQTIKKLSLFERELSKIHPCKIKTHIIKDDDFLHLPKLNGNHLTYYRLKASSILPKDVKRYLYLDVDMLVLGDIREIFTIDLDGKVAGVVLDYFKKKRFLIPKIENNQKLNISKGYFNAGAVLVDLEKWREQRVDDLCDYFSKNYYAPQHDQDILNGALLGKIHILSPKWNFLADMYCHCILKDESRFHYKIQYDKNTFKDALCNTKILHFYRHYKPWKDRVILYNFNGESLSDLWWNIAYKTPIFTLELKEVESKINNNKNLFIAQLGYTLLQKSNNLFTFFTLPIIAKKMIKQYRDNSKILAINIPKEQYNLSYEIGSMAFDKPKFSLLDKIYRVKKRILFNQNRAL